VVMRSLTLLTHVVGVVAPAPAAAAAGLCFLSTTSTKRLLTNCSTRTRTICNARDVRSISSPSCLAARMHSAAAAAAAASAPAPSSGPSSVLDQVETTLSHVFSNGITPDTNVLDLPPDQREAVGVAINIRQRLDALDRSGDCRTCWLQKKHCVCSQCPPCEVDVSTEQSTLPRINRLFLLTHHKEVGLVVDTAKLLLSSLPTVSKLVVGGIGEEYQASMGELLDAVNCNVDSDKRNSGTTKCLVLFPSEDARTFDEIEKSSSETHIYGHDDKYDVVVVDGTWQQARKLYNRYIPSEEDGGPLRVRLSEKAVAILNGDNIGTATSMEDSSDTSSNIKQRIPGHQLRRHPVKWREVSTLEATRLLFRDMMGDYSSPSSNAKPWDALALYQEIADDAAQRQLGPPRISES